MELSGTWERGGRSPNSAALAGLLGVGIVYFYGQSFIAGIIMFWANAHHPVEAGDASMYRHLSAITEITKTPVRLCVSLTQFGLMLLPTWWLVRRWHTRQVPEYVRLNACSPSQIALAVVTILFFYPANIFASELLLDGLHMPEELVKINQRIFTASSGGEFLFVLAVIALTPAICEEMLFRGYAQRTLERTMGGKSVVLVGVLFGLYHMNPLGLLSLSALGLVFGYFYFVSRSLLPGMAAHFTNNTLAALWLYLSTTPAAWAVEALHQHIALAALITLPVAAAALLAFRKITRKRELERDPPPEAYLNFSA